MIISGTKAHKFQMDAMVAPMHEVARLDSSHEALKAALVAIRARIKGEFDAPELMAFGPLSTRIDDDIRAIVDAALRVAA